MLTTRKGQTEEGEGQVLMLGKEQTEVGEEHGANATWGEREKRKKDTC